MVTSNLIRSYLITIYFSVYAQVVWQVILYNALLVESTNLSKISGVRLSFTNDLENITALSKEVHIA